MLLGMQHLSRVTIQIIALLFFNSLPHSPIFHGTRIMLSATTSFASTPFFRYFNFFGLLSPPSLPLISITLILVSAATSCPSPLPFLGHPTSIMLFSTPRPSILNGGTPLPCPQTLPTSQSIEPTGASVVSTFPLDCRLLG